MWPCTKIWFASLISSISAYIGRFFDNMFWMPCLPGAFLILLHFIASLITLMWTTSILQLFLRNVISNAVTVRSVW
uniref:Putative product n=1 Tax=Xenopsylla cheopis TaxID=163159 RepID=A0A6M2DZQ1_XENCH